MLRKLVTAIVILSLVVQGSDRLFILINFKIHQAYIARFLCENRNNPKAKCDGMCHLKKELKKNDEEQKHDQQPPNVQLRDQQLFLPVSVKTSLSNLIQPSVNKFLIPHNSGAPASGFTFSLFQPPDRSLV